MSHTIRSATIRRSSQPPPGETSGLDAIAARGLRPFGLRLARLGLACLGLVCLTVACGQGDGGGAPVDDAAGVVDDEVADEPVVDDAGPEPGEDGIAAIELVIDGRDTLPGQARFTIWEDVNSVELSITGAGGSADFLQIDLILPVFYELVGDHHSDLGVPLSVGNVVNASLSGEDLFSRTGAVDLSVTGEGHIEGTFSVSMASAEGIDSDDTAFQGAAEVAALSGRFTGNWVMTCFSRLPGHMTWVPGGEFCQSLQLR